ncbi:MAG: hypothetical protein KA408_10015 [Flavobacteriales bacterium]|nr:hypothetical protein [Flavobacteriales bacterium]
MRAALTSGARFEQIQTHQEHRRATLVRFPCSTHFHAAYKAHEPGQQEGKRYSAVGQDDPAECVRPAL